MHREELVEEFGIDRVLSAWESCKRMISASMPPTRNQRKEVTAYRVPMRLWSTVLIQLQMPYSLFGLGKMRGNLIEMGSLPTPGCVVCMVEVI